MIEFIDNGHYVTFCDWIFWQLALNNFLWFEFFFYSGLYLTFCDWVHGQWTLFKYLWLSLLTMDFMQLSVIAFTGTGQYATQLWEEAWALIEISVCSDSHPWPKPDRTHYLLSQWLTRSVTSCFPYDITNPWCKFPLC